MPDRFRKAVFKRACTCIVSVFNILVFFMPLQDSSDCRALVFVFMTEKKMMKGTIYKVIIVNISIIWKKYMVRAELHQSVHFFSSSRLHFKPLKLIHQDMGVYI